ncbi:MAG: glycosyltransferase family 2 protein [Candidatus Bathyarchaeia archaeon]
MFQFGGERNFGSTKIVIAALNEEEGIGLTIAELERCLKAQSILVVDGHSRDRTVEVAKDLGAEIVVQTGRGKGDAIFEALTRIDPSVDYIVMTDADFTYPAEHVPAMIEILKREPQVGMVCGNRFGKRTDYEALRGQFYLGNRLLAFAHRLLNGVDLKDPLTGLRVIRVAALKGWRVKSKGFDIEVELNHQVEHRGFKTVEVPIGYRPRLGEKKLKVKDGAVILKRMLLESTQRLR